MVTLRSLKHRSFFCFTSLAFRQKELWIFCIFQIRSEDGQPLSGVLLSLSGGQFRSNLLTQDTGLLTFNNLVRMQHLSGEQLFAAQSVSLVSALSSRVLGSTTSNL